jgi:hypothetical protein
LHLRYGLKICQDAVLPDEDRKLVARTRRLNPSFQYDSTLASGLEAVGGVDFSAEMIRLAKEKLIAAGLMYLAHGPLYFKEGSAFDLEPMPPVPLPLVVSVCNSVGVTQGLLGATELFRSMRRAVESGGGIAIISGYRAEAVDSFALGNYESTMNVCGQPRWLDPDTYATPDYVQVPRLYKRAHDTDPTITVDVFDKDGNMIEKGHMLQRNPLAVKKTLDEGHILTHTEYESHWYSFEQFEQWIATLWPEGKAYHIAGQSLDALRAEPVQLAILDMNDELARLFARWRV